MTTPTTTIRDDYRPGTVWCGKPGQADRKIVHRGTFRLAWVGRDALGTFVGRTYWCTVATFARWAKGQL
jgi:hypothetical protein